MFNSKSFPFIHTLKKSKENETIKNIKSDLDSLYDNNNKEQIFPNSSLISPNEKFTEKSNFISKIEQIEKPIEDNPERNIRNENDLFNSKLKTINLKNPSDQKEFKVVYFTEKLNFEFEETEKIENNLKYILNTHLHSDPENDCDDSDSKRSISIEKEKEEKASLKNNIKAISTKKDLNINDANLSNKAILNKTINNNFFTSNEKQQNKRQNDEEHLISPLRNSFSSSRFFENKQQIGFFSSLINDIVHSNFNSNLKQLPFNSSNSCFTSNKKVFDICELLEKKENYSSFFSYFETFTENKNPKQANLFNNTSKKLLFSPEEGVKSKTAFELLSPEMHERKVKKGLIFNELNFDRKFNFKVLNQKFNNDNNNGDSCKIQNINSLRRPKNISAIEDFDNNDNDNVYNHLNLNSLLIQKADEGVMQIDSASESLKRAKIADFRKLRKKDQSLLTSSQANFDLKLITQALIEKGNTLNKDYVDSNNKQIKCPNAKVKIDNSKRIKNINERHYNYNNKENDPTSQNVNSALKNQKINNNKNNLNKQNSIRRFSRSRENMAKIDKVFQDFNQQEFIFPVIIKGEEKKINKISKITTEFYSSNRNKQLKNHLNKNNRIIDLTSNSSQDFKLTANGLLNRKRITSTSNNDSNTSLNKPKKNSNKIIVRKNKKIYCNETNANNEEELDKDANMVKQLSSEDNCDLFFLDLQEFEYFNKNENKLIDNKNSNNNNNNDSKINLNEDENNNSNKENNEINNLNPTPNEKKLSLNYCQNLPMKPEKNKTSIIDPYDSNFFSKLKNQEFFFHSLKKSFPKIKENEGLDIYSAFKLSKIQGVNSFENAFLDCKDKYYITPNKQLKSTYNKSFSGDNSFIKKNFYFSKSKNIFNSEKIRTYEIRDSSYKKQLICEILLNKNNNLNESLNAVDFQKLFKDENINMNSNGFDFSCFNKFKKECLRIFDVKEFFNSNTAEDVIKNDIFNDSNNNRNILGFFNIEEKICFWTFIEDFFCADNLKKDEAILRRKFNDCVYLTAEGKCFLEKLFIEKVSFLEFLGKTINIFECESFMADLIIKENGYPSIIFTNKHLN